MAHGLTRVLAVIIAGLCAGQAGAQNRSAVIPVRLSGTVVVADTGEPLAGADIRLLETGAKTFTAPDGHFEFENVAPGWHTVIASRSGYVTGATGMSGPKDRPRPIELTAGRPSHVEIRLLALGAITGRIVDEAGRPATGIQMRAIRRRATPSPNERGGAAVSVDGDGRFAIRGLDPGKYFVIADKRGPRAAQRAGSSLSNTRREGDALASITYFPGTAFPDQAGVVDVEAGVQTDATFTLASARLARITGTVLDSRGEPARDYTVRATTTRAPQLADLPSMGFALDGERFELTGLPPGEYVIEAIRMRADPLAPPYIPPALALRPTGERARTTVQISGDDVTGVTLRLSAGFKVSGRIVDVSGNPIEAAGLPVSATSTDDRLQQILAITGADGTFVLDNLLGRYLLRLAQPAVGKGFALERVQTSGVDTIDEGVDVAHDTFVDLVVSAPTQIRGVVRTRDGVPMPKVSVVIFAERPAAWTLPNSRFVRYEQASSLGEFQIVGLPAGRYYAAVPGGVLAEEAGATPFVDDFATLLTSATPFSLANGETKSLVVTVD